MTYLSFQRMFQAHLQRAPYSSICPTQVYQSWVVDRAGSSNSRDILAHHIQSIPVSKTKRSAVVVYQSPIALKLQQTVHWPCQKIAQNLKDWLLNARLTPANAPLFHQPLISVINGIWPHIKIEVLANGWLQFCCSNQGLEQWCSHFERISSQQSISKLTKDDLPIRFPQYIPQIDAFQITPETSFRLQYNYARCHALTNRIQPLVESSLRSPQTELAQSRFRLSNQAEQDLLHSVIELADSCFSGQSLPSARYFEQQLLKLSHGSEQLCRQYACIQNDGRRYVYLKLLLAAQAVLEHCLTAVLRIAAPTRL